MLNLRSTALAAALMLSATAASAQSTGAEGYFTIYNNTDNNSVTGFYSNDGSGWSDNWLDQTLAPRESAQAQFVADEGSCEQVLQVGWLGESGGEVLDEPITIDICDASNVYLDDNEIYFD